MGIEHNLRNPVNMIIQIVNTQGIMKGGVAKGIADRYPIVKEEYERYCKQIKGSLLGKLQVIDFIQPEYSATEMYYVANLFAIDKPNFNWHKQSQESRSRVVSYPALYYALSNLAAYIRLLPIEHSTFGVMVPSGMGTLRGGGDWDIIKEGVDYHLGFTNLQYYTFD